MAPVYKFSNVGGFTSKNFYTSILAGNPKFEPDNGSIFPLGEFTLASTQTNVTFTNIPQTYKHLQLRCFFLGDTTTGYDVSMQFNNDTASNYRWHRLYGNGTSALAQGAVSATTGMYVAADAARTLYPVAAIIDILDYTSTNKNKTVRNFTGHDQNGGGAVALWSNLWMNSTTAVSSIKISVASNNFAANSNFALYGVLA